MKRFVWIALILLLTAALLTACYTRENPPETHIVHDGQLWKVPRETTAVALPEDAELIECEEIPLERMPARENECNVSHGVVRVYDGEDYFLVIIDGVQHLIQR